MQALKLFGHEQFGQVRIIEEDGTVLFCGSDIARALGYAEPHKAITRHCKGGTKRPILTKGGKQDIFFIPEGDVYRLVARSNLPSAEQFESWIFDEVLPTIRKTGAYVTPQADIHQSDPMIREVIESMQQMLVTLTRYLDNQDNCTFPTAQSDVFGEADSCRRAIEQPRQGRQRIRTRSTSKIEQEGYIPDVILLLEKGLTYTQTAKALCAQGKEIGKSTIGRFRQNMVCSKIEGNVLYVAMKNGNAYSYDLNTLDALTIKGKF